MTGYIKDWVAENGTEAGIQDVGFAQAYLSWSGKNGRTCNLVASNTCDAPETDNAAYQNEQQFYTLWNIFAVQQFYAQYSTALSVSQPLASAKLGQIVDHVAPPVEHTVGYPEWFNMLMMGVVWAGFAVVPVSFGGAGAILEAQLIGPLIVAGLWAVSRTPPFTDIRTGYTQTAEDRFQTLANVDGDLADIVSTYLKQVSDEVKAIQNNVESFIALCEPGGFSVRVTLDLNEQSLALYKSLELFTLAEALTANGVIIAKSTGINPMQVAKDTGEITCPGFGPAGNCYTWWYDKDNGNTYAFHDTNKLDRDFTDLINWIWDQKLVDNMAEIFANEACAGKTMNATIEPNTTPKTICAMNTKNYEYAYKPGDQPDWLHPNNKQFTNCDNDRDYLADCEWFGEQVVLPLSYLGPYLHHDSYCRVKG
ncbi:hypothetical protein EJ03DRAFT_338096 [Teratosphaeria nubilosa]|uniref:Uncharacterized protein n=1 Tax=Teratosphaeria nubilosa TaxID=161662 RepID=A0A6G1L355_9PEZI|nr:hypothetical protein EJ03DRAFT_338096 [Teratosphaeria nubilosa]